MPKHYVKSKDTSEDLTKCEYDPEIDDDEIEAINGFDISEDQTEDDDKFEE